MFAEPGSQHHTPHFHAYYQSEVAIFSIDPVELMAGSLARRQRRLVEAWAELHQAELRADWERLQQGRNPAPIDPLKQAPMSHPIYRVRSFEVVAPYTLHVRFDDNTGQ